ncbi:MAG: ABC transporter permease [Propionibacteriaceae bacterium]|nr:ABC transporter permease [Propionibacteriaceae bacterium]
MSATTLKPVIGEPAVFAPISWKTPIVLGVLGLVSLLGFSLFAAPGAISQVAIATGNDWLGTIRVGFDSRSSIIVLTAAQLLLAGWAWRQTAARRPIRIWLPISFGVCFVGAFLLWSVAGSQQALQFTGLLSGALFLSVPLVFGSLAGCVCEHVGVINVAIEGQLLAGAFLAAVVGAASGNSWLGLLAAPVAGALVGALLALFAVRYWVDHIIVGVVLNVFVTGVTSYLFSTVLSHNRAVFGVVEALPAIPIPLLSQIPVLGPVLFAQNVLVYIMYAAVVVLQIMLYRSKWGLRMRACGEHPKAADTVGIKVNRTRILNTILGGAIAGLGGAYFTVAAGLAFGKEMSAGRGFIALAAMILGGWRPAGAIAAALLFGFADNLQNALGVIGVSIPSQFMLMAPYLVTIFAVAGLVGKVRPPAAEGTAYKG